MSVEDRLRRLAAGAAGERSLPDRWVLSRGAGPDVEAWLALADLGDAAGVARALLAGERAPDRTAEGEMSLVLDVAAAIRDLKGLVGLAPEAPAEVVVETRAYGSHRVLEENAEALRRLAGAHPFSVKSWLAEWPPRCLARRVQDVEVLLPLPEGLDTASACARIRAEAETMRARLLDLPEDDPARPSLKAREARLRDLLGMLTASADAPF